MAENGQSRVPLTGKAIYDKDLYGGSSPDRFAAEDEQDERERAVARWGWNDTCLLPLVGVKSMPSRCHVRCLHSKLQSYTAPKNLVIPEQEAGDEEVCLCDGSVFAVAELC